MDVDTVEGRSFGRGRGGPVRTQRVRPGSSPYIRPASTGSVGDIWKHDLFDSSSSLYAPKVSRIWSGSSSAPWIAQPSASLRPFGALTPGAGVGSSSGPPALVTSIPIAPAPIRPAPAAPAQSLSERMGLASAGKPPNLAARMGIQGLASQVGTTPSVPPPTGPAGRKGKGRQAGAGPAAVAAAANPSAQSNAMAHAKVAREAMKEQVQKGTRVLVGNLAEGTTAEDVKTAFGEFGLVLECRIVNPSANSLTAEIIFEDKAHAVSAVERLNGAIADNRTLSVTLVETPPPKPTPAARAKPNPIVSPPAGPKLQRSIPPSGPRHSFPLAATTTHPVTPAGPRAAFQQPPRSVPVQRQASSSGDLAARMGLILPTSVGSAGGGAGGSGVGPIAPRGPGAGAGGGVGYGRGQRNGAVVQQQQQQQQRMGIDPEPVAGRMASDFIMSIDPRAQISSEPPRIVKEPRPRPNHLAGRLQPMPQQQQQHPHQQPQQNWSQGGRGFQQQAQQRNTGGSLLGRIK